MKDEQQNTEAGIRELLKQHGLKATPQRVRIYEAMCALGHASADSVYHYLADSHDRLTLATVYNVLESMTGVGLLTRRPSFNNKMFFDVNTDGHCHLYRHDILEICDLRDDALQQEVEARVRAQLPAGLQLDRVEIQILCHCQ